MEAIVDPDLVVKYEPSESAQLEEDVQIMESGGVGADGISCGISDGGNEASANESLESTVRILVGKVRTLEEQITACLEGQPLLYQLFGKCNRMEQRLRALKKDVDGRFAKMMGEGAATESRPLTSTSRIRHRVPRNQFRTDKEKDAKEFKENEPSSDDDEENFNEEPDWNTMDAEEEEDPGRDLDLDSASDSIPPHPAIPKPFQCKLCPPTARACYSIEVNLAKHYTSTHTQSEGAAIINNEAPEIQEAAAKLKLEAKSTTTTKGPTGKQNSDRLPYRTCRHCSKVFPRSSEMHIHVANQHSDTKLTRIPCDICGQSFRRKAGAKEHQLKEHGRLTEKMMTLIQPRRRNFQGRQVACPEKCGRSFPVGRKHELAHHLIACRKLKPHQCEECGDRFGYLSALRDHKRFIHNNEGAEPEPCPECGVMVPNRRMKAHLREHAKIRDNPAGLLRFFCSNCGKGFRFAGQLQRHEMSHTGERPFACPHPGCGKTYPHKSQLDSHTLAHTGKPYSCEECGWSFVKPYLLRKHQLSHLKGTAKAKAKKMAAAAAKEEGIVQPTPPQRQPRRYNYLEKERRAVGNVDQT